MFDLYDEINDELYSYNEDFEMNYNEEYDDYDMLYNEDGSFFLEDSAMLYFENNEFDLEQALNEAVEAVLIEHIDTFNEAVGITEENYIKASNEIIKKTQDEFNKLAANLKGDKPESAKKKLRKFSESLEAKISKIKTYIGNGQWDKAVRFTLGTSDLKRIASIAGSVVGGAAVGGALGLTNYSKIRSNAAAFKSNAVDALKRRKHLKDKNVVNMHQNYNPNTKRLTYSYDKKKEKSDLRKERMQARKNALKNSMNSLKNNPNRKRAMITAGVGAGLGLSISGGSALINFVTSKKVSQLPTVQAQVKKYLQFLIALNNKVKTLAR